MVKMIMCCVHIDYRFMWDSKVDVVTRLQVGQYGVQILVGVRNFFFSRLSLVLTHPAIQWLPGLKWLEHEAEHSSPWVPRLRMGRGICRLLLYDFIACTVAVLPFL
jgi:hypothetical protein